eukprot:gene5937-7393_t
MSIIARDGVAPFIKSLIQMLETPENSHLIRWGKTSESIVITNCADFETKLLPKYFKTGKFCSFIRQLNIYGFHKVEDEKASVNDEPHHETSESQARTFEFANDNFKKNQPDLMVNIKRRKSVRRSLTINNNNPNHYKTTLPGPNSAGAGGAGGSGMFDDDDGDDHVGNGGGGGGGNPFQIQYSYGSNSNNPTPNGNQSIQSNISTPSLSPTTSDVTKTLDSMGQNSTTHMLYQFTKFQVEHNELKFSHQQLQESHSQLQNAFQSLQQSHQNLLERVLKLTKAILDHSILYSNMNKQQQQIQQQQQQQQQQQNLISNLIPTAPSTASTQMPIQTTASPQQHLLSSPTQSLNTTPSTFTSMNIQPIHQPEINTNTNTNTTGLNNSNNSSSSNSSSNNSNANTNIFALIQQLAAGNNNNTNNLMSSLTPQQIITLQALLQSQQQTQQQQQQQQQQQSQQSQQIHSSPQQPTQQQHNIHLSPQAQHVHSPHLLPNFSPNHQNQQQQSQQTQQTQQSQQSQQTQQAPQTNTQLLPTSESFESEQYYNTNGTQYTIKDETTPAEDSNKNLQSFLLEQEIFTLQQSGPDGFKRNKSDISLNTTTGTGLTNGLTLSQNLLLNNTDFFNTSDSRQNPSTMDYGSIYQFN